MTFKEWLNINNISSMQFSRLSEKSKKDAKRLYESTMLPSRYIRLTKLEYDTILKEIKDELRRV